MQSLHVLAVSLFALHVVVEGAKGTGSDAVPAALAPRLTVEPPPLVRFAASRGVRVPCAARGLPAPTVSWLRHDGSPLAPSPYWRVLDNGTLEVAGGAARAAVTLRCRADNARGAVLSREVRLQPVFNENWEATLRTQPVAAGGVAALWCGARAGGDLVEPALWYKDGRVLDVDAPHPAARLMRGGAWLLVRAVGARDAGEYACLARDALSQGSRRSPPRNLTLAVGPFNSPPRIIASTNEVTVQLGDQFCIPCVAPEDPAPNYTWYREVSGRLQAVVAGAPAAAWLWARGAALCVTRADATLAGAWLCKANNAYGDATAQTRVHVLGALTVTVTPTVVVAPAGSTVQLNCSANDAAAHKQWLHDGAPVAARAEADGVLRLRAVAQPSAGVYQCVARTGSDVAHDVAELRLADSTPELLYTFIEQVLRGDTDGTGTAVSLRCAASGAPAPHFTWLLDDQPLDRLLPPHRYSVTEETSLAGDTVSSLNITGVSAADGGRYTCRAHNTLGVASHSARLNIYGPPSVRAVGPLRVVAGENVTIFCPYAGYPISSVTWWRGADGASLEADDGGGGGEGRVQSRGATLLVRGARPSDAGLYACRARAPDGRAARRDFELQVRNPPKISPFIFSSELTEGSSAQVLCGVSSGDRPMYFSWVKDGTSLPSDLQIEEKSLNEFSLLMFSDLSARHSGAYTCRVTNHAASVNYTAALDVKVAPSWVAEPADVSALSGAPLILECAAKGYPTPSVTWYKKVGLDVVADSLSKESGDIWQKVGAEWIEESSQEKSSGQIARRVRLRSTASRARRGLYRCRADNGVPPTLLKSFRLIVHESARFDVSSGNNVTVVRGQSASLSCLALGDEPLDVQWTHSGRKLDVDSYRSTVTEARTAEGRRSTLQLRATVSGDAGEYHCHAKNQYGRSELVMFLYVEEPPPAPAAVALRGLGSRWARVSWRSPATTLRYSARCTQLHPPLDVPALLNHTLNLTLEQNVKDDRIDADGWRRLSAMVKHLRPAAAYSLRLVADNHVGQSPLSDPILFTTLEEAPSGPPLQVQVTSVTFEELHISWSPPEPNSMNGEVLGYVATWSAEDTAAPAGWGRGAGGRGVHVIRGGSTGALVLGQLRASVKYAVSVRAFTAAGAGPLSPPLYASTANGVPEDPPSDVRCEPESARSVRVSWAPPASPSRTPLSFDIDFAPLRNTDPKIDKGVNGERVQVTGGARGTLVRGLRAGTLYVVSVRVRGPGGAPGALGPTASPARCTTLEDVPGAPAAVRAVAAGPDSVRVTWLPPVPEERSGQLTHYTLYIRELGDAGSEWAQRVEIGGDPTSRGLGEGGEVRAELRGLRARAHALAVRAHSAAGRGAASAPLTAAPHPPMAARIASIGRKVSIVLGGSVRLPCVAVGAPPLRRHWTPAPPARSFIDTGDLVLRDVGENSSGNYTCSVSNAGGTDVVMFVVDVVVPPHVPAVRLLRSTSHSLVVTWPPPAAGVAPILWYSVRWSRLVPGEGGAARESVAGGGDTRVALRGLACGTRYRVSVRAHAAAGPSPHAPPLIARTIGDKAKAPLGKEFVWANSTAIRLNLLAWGGQCPVYSWSVALREEAGGAAPWRDLPADADTDAATAWDLRPGTWYEIRILARTMAGDTVALYRAATLTLDGERLGTPSAMGTGAQASDSESADGRGGWRAGAAPALAGGALAALLAGLAALVLARRRASCLRRCSPAAPPALLPSTSLYCAEPAKGDKGLGGSDAADISPYATFSMAGCALHLLPSPSSDLAAPAACPSLLSSHPAVYTGASLGRSECSWSSRRASDSASEWSGSPSPCPACARAAAERAPAPGPPASPPRPRARFRSRRRRAPAPAATHAPALSRRFGDADVVARGDPGQPCH